VSIENFVELSLMPGALGELHESITTAIERVDVRIEYAVSKARAQHWAGIRDGLVDAREQIEAQYTERRLPMSHDCAEDVCHGMPLEDLEGADWTDRWPYAEWCDESQRWLLKAALKGTDDEIETHGLIAVRIYEDGSVEAVEEDEYLDGYIAKIFDIDRHNAAIAAKETEE